MTQIRLTPTAVRSGRPNPSVRSGTIRIPPPRPRSEPKRPAPMPPARRRTPSIIGRSLGRVASGGRRSGRLGPEVLRRVRQQGDDPGALQGDGQLPLVGGAGAGLPTRLDLRALREVAAEAVDLLVVDRDGLVGAEGADLPAAPVAVVVVALLGSCGGWHAGSPRGAAGAARSTVRSGSGGQNGRSSRSLES